MRHSHTPTLLPPTGWRAAVSLAAAILALVALAAPAVSSATVIAAPGEGAGQVKEPGGLAVNRETGRLYVADKGNNRIDVFASSGAFEKAFGWGVRDGAPEFQFCTTACRKGLEGAGSGEFKLPSEIAVDNTGEIGHQGDVYVVDYENQRVEKFDENGNFLLTFGGGVDKKTNGNVCTKESADPCGTGADGFEEGKFARENVGFGLEGILVGVGPGGVVYVVDTHIIDHESETHEPAVSKYRLQRFEPSGVEIAPQHVLFEGNLFAGGGGVAHSLAVDSTGNFYVASEFGEEVVSKYEADGTKVGNVFASDDGVLAVGVGDRLFVSGNAEGGSSLRFGVGNVVEYDSAGGALRRFGYGLFGPEATAEGVAPDGAGVGVYASEVVRGVSGGSDVLHLDFPADDRPVVFRPCEVTPGTLGNTQATLRALINPEANATTYHFEYVTQAQFEASGFSSATVTPQSASIGEDTVLHEASAKLEELTPETVYHCRVVAKNTVGEATGEEGTFKTREPVELGPEWSSGVTEDSAVLQAEVNPVGIATTGQFEYVTDAEFQASGFAQAKLAPSAELDFGAGGALVSTAAQLSGLAPGTRYHYRLRAKDKFFPGGIVCPELKFSCPEHELTFRTYPSFGSPPPTADERRYELVSPIEKNSAEIGVPEQRRSGGVTVSTGYRLIRASSGSGEAMTFTSFTSFDSPEAAPATSQYLARRTEAGWSTENISPVGAQQSPVPPYRGFSPDLGLSAFVVSQPRENEELVRNLYLRDDHTGAVQRLTDEEPNINNGEEFCLDYAGASADGTRAFFAANGSYAGAPAGNGFSLYEWSAGEGLHPLSILPGKSTAVAPTAATGFGAGQRHCQSGETVSRNVVSADGQRVYWTYVPEAGPSRLLVRIAGQETIQLDNRLAGATGSSGEGVFQGASTDGSKAFFTDKSRLTPGASEGDLYLYELPGGELKNLTPGSEAAGVEGMVGISDDGSYAYFVATGVLDGEANALGEKAEAGKHNLYLYHEGHVEFIAGLSGEDSNVWGSDGQDSSTWGPNPHLKVARLSPDGRSLAFLSVEAKRLAGYDNTVVDGGHCRLPEFPQDSSVLEGSPICPEAFLYDAQSRDLSCVSCNPSGERPSGPTILPGWSNPFEGPRYLSDDGSRLFFESVDALLPQDENHKRDVYEFERPGHGTCVTDSAWYDPASGGCHFLLSDGKSPDDSYLLDASSSGRDVFLSTRSRLTGSDTDENYDIYDFREGGGFPEPQTPPDCQAEGCRAPARTMMSLSGALGSATFTGVGNLTPEVAKPKVKPKSKPLTRAQNLAKALKRCKKDKPGKKRARCEKSARGKYGRRK
jgi:DNA-binding beta-propeller fold protein YncE